MSSGSACCPETPPAEPGHGDGLARADPLSAGAVRGPPHGSPARPTAVGCAASRRRARLRTPPARPHRRCRTRQRAGPSDTARDIEHRLRSCAHCRAARPRLPAAGGRRRRGRAPRASVPSDGPLWGSRSARRPDGERADEIERDLVGRNVLDGRWTFQMKERRRTPGIPRTAAAPNNDEQRQPANLTCRPLLRSPRG